MVGGIRRKFIKGKLDVRPVTAVIAAGAAILSSALTSYLTHHLERRRNRREYELKWLQERFRPALDFLGRVLAVIGHISDTQEARKQIADEIHEVVVGPVQENNAWCIAVLLDPEDTGLRDHILSAMRYAHITESDEELNSYWARLSMSLEALAEEFRRERQAIVTGQSLETLIKERKTEVEKSTRRFREALQAIKSFSAGEADLNQVLGKVEKSRIRGATLDLMLRLPGVDDQEKLKRLEDLRRECKKRRWLPGI